MENAVVPEDPEARWEWFLGQVDAHLARLKERFKDDPEMLELLNVAEKIRNGDFEFTWKKEQRTVVVEGVIELTHDSDIIPSKEALQGYLLGGYPAMVFLLFMKRLEKLFDSDRLAIRARDFEVLRTTLHNLELLGAQQMPDTIEMAWKGDSVVLKLPLEVSADAQGVPTDLWGMSMLIAANLDRVLKTIEDMLIEV